MFFRNLTLFRFAADVAADLQRLDDVLPEHALRPCGPLEMFTHGFVPPIGRGDDAPLVHSVAHCTLFTAGGEDKLLPAAVINDELRKKVDRITDEECRRVGGRERKRIKEDILTELLPRAFTRSSRLSAYVDLKHGWLVIDSSSRKQAEQVLTMTREALGSFPAVPMAPEESPRVLMTDWLANGTMPAGLALGDECELRDPATATGAIAMCRRQDMDAEEIKEHLRNGKQVFKLGLVFDDRLSFVLGEDLVVRKLRFLDVVMDQMGDPESAADEASSSITLMALELQRLLAKFEEWFGLQVDAPLRLHKQEAPAGMRGVMAAASKLDNMLREDGTTATIEHAGKVLGSFGDRADPVLGQALAVVRRSGKASIAAVQRELRIGYNRASRIIETLEQQGYVSAPNSQGVRTVTAP